MTLPPRPPKPVQFIDSAEWEVRDYIGAIERRCDDLEGKVQTLSVENDELIAKVSELSEARSVAQLITPTRREPTQAEKDFNEMEDQFDKAMRSDSEPAKPQGRPTITKTPAQEQTVLDHFKAHGVARIRELAELLDVSKGTAHNWLKAMKDASDHKCEHCGEPSVSQFCGTICEVEHRKGEEFQ